MSDWPGYLLYTCEKCGQTFWRYLTPTESERGLGLAEPCRCGHMVAPEMVRTESMGDGERVDILAKALRRIIGRIEQHGATENNMEVCKVLAQFALERAGQRTDSL